jgi:cytochrome P450
LGEQFCESLLGKLLDLLADSGRNAELSAQKGYNTLADCMISTIRWMPPNIMPHFAKLNPARRYMQWSNGRKMDKYIGDILDERFDEMKKDPGSIQGKSAMDLVLKTQVEDGVNGMTDRLDPEFRIFAIRQIRLFLFAGHDSTSSTICYCIHMLSKHPKVLEKLRAEHDAVFGNNLSSVSSKLKSRPHLINNLPYTLAVIKESIRFFPPANGIRQGSANADVADDLGNICPTENAMVWTGHMQMATAPKYWVRGNEFLPERWIVEPDHELYPMKGAWRPFENGPRNCIAQSLVMIEIKVVLAHLAREFDFENAYEEWDLLNPRKGIKNIRGNRAFLIDEGAAHPVDYYPCRVSVRA